MKKVSSRKLPIAAKPVTGLAVCPSRELVAVAQTETESREHPTLSLWSTETWKKVDSVERRGSVHAACPTANGSHLIYAMGDALILYDLEQLTKQRLETDGTSIGMISASRSSSRFAVSGRHVEVWDAATGERVWRLEGHVARNDPLAVALTRDDAVLIAGQTRDAVVQIDLGSGESSTRFTPGSGAATCMSAGCRDQVFALVSRDPHADYLWDVTTGERILPELFGDRFGSSTSLSLHPTKRYVARGSVVGYVSLQDLDRNGEFVFSERLHRSSVSSVLVVGDAIVSGSYDGTVWITEIPS
ncbi:MAG: WD40 repeat domain-containing protein [Kofleriaceae bacterium]|nr:WD40 repeat domain-containing protein [Kofleriaceae bacterium]